MSRLSVRLVVVAILLCGGWLLLRRPGSVGLESPRRQPALLRLAPAGSLPAGADPAALQTPVAPEVVVLRDVPPGVYDPTNQYDRWMRGEIDLLTESVVDPATMAELREASLNLAPDSEVQQVPAGPGTLAPVFQSGFDSLDLDDCCGGGANVPPDPQLAVGPEHIISVVNVALEITDKQGNVLLGPTTFASFLGAATGCDTGLFDPNVLYDEDADRFFLGIVGDDGNRYCAAASTSGDPTGSWYVYSFPTTTGSEFFDYPHAGVGREAVYFSANIFQFFFGMALYDEARIYALEKTLLYAGDPVTPVVRGLGSSHFTAQPLHLHGATQDSWPAAGPHYFFAKTGNATGNTYTVFAWEDPFGANSVTTVGTVDLDAATGVTSGQAIDVPQQGGDDIQANDWRPQDFEYRDGFAWSVNTVACNPGDGTVNCVRWVQIDPATATVTDAGVYAAAGTGEHRFFADVAVNGCGDMAVGYSKSSDTMWPGIWVTGRENGDPAGTLQGEIELKAGEIVYTAFDAPARRWGDYTEMTIDPDGMTFWYLGQYSKDIANPNGRWGTYVSSFSFPACTPPALGLEPATVEGTVAIDQQGNESLEIGNGGAMALRWTATEAAGPGCEAPQELGWVSVSPAEGEVPAGITTTLTVNFDGAGLTVGDYTGTLCLESNDPNTPLQAVTLILSVVEPTGVALGRVESPVADPPPWPAALAVLVVLTALVGERRRQANR